MIAFLNVCAHIADSWHIFHIHLPLFAQFFEGIGMPTVLRFLLGRLYPLAITEPDEHTVLRAWMSAVSLLLTQLAVQLTNADVGVATMVVPDSVQFLLCMSIGCWLRGR